jgi:hypothetical protein
VPDVGVACLLRANHPLENWQYTRITVFQPSPRAKLSKLAN